MNEMKKNFFLLKHVLTVNKIGDEGAKFLSEALKKNTTLTELDLSDEISSKEYNP